MYRDITYHTQTDEECTQAHKKKYYRTSFSLRARLYRLRSIPASPSHPPPPQLRSEKRRKHRKPCEESFLDKLKPFSGENTTRRSEKQNKTNMHSVARYPILIFPRLQKRAFADLHKKMGKLHVPRARSPSEFINMRRGKEFRATSKEPQAHRLGRSHISRELLLFRKQYTEKKGNKRGIGEVKKGWCVVMVVRADSRGKGWVICH